MGTYGDVDELKSRVGIARVVQHIDQRHLDVLKVAEESERGILEGMLAEYRDGYWDGAGGVP